MPVLEAAAARCALHLLEQVQVLQLRSGAEAPRDNGAFLERHPSLVPGSNSVDADSGHAAFPLAVISKPKLPGLSDREPDFMWLDLGSTAGMTLKRGRLPLWPRLSPR
jgi:hypothetical protein